MDTSKKQICSHCPHLLKSHNRHGCKKEKGPKGCGCLWNSDMAMGAALLAQHQDDEHSGHPCPTCGSPTKEQGLYELVDGRLKLVEGDGAEEISVDDVVDVSGELAARLRDEGYFDHEYDPYELK